MGLFTRGLGKPGKGIDENAESKRAFFRFFDIFFRKFWHFIRLNLLYILFLIPTMIIVYLVAEPIVNAIFSLGNLGEILNQVGQDMAQNSTSGTTAEVYSAQLVFLLNNGIRFIFVFVFMSLWGMGPATAGFSYVLRNFAREEHAWIWSDFKDSAMSNFKQSSVIFIIDMVVYLLFFTGLWFYSNASGPMSYVRYILYMFLILYTMMHFYIYQMMVTFKLSTIDLYKNALLFAIGKLPSNILVLFIILAINILPIYLAVIFSGAFSVLGLIIVLLLQLLILQSLSGFVIAFNASAKMKKYMLTDYEVKVKNDVA